MSLNRFVSSTFLGAFLSASLANGQVATPATVSPGQEDRYALVRSSCPTFSWALVAGASRYRIEIFRVDDVDGETSGIRTSTLHLPGTASSWTPDADDCLASGSTYAWFVRAERHGEPGAWSQARLLEISAEPTASEVLAAREVLARYLVSEGAVGDSAALPPAATSGRTAGSPTRASRAEAAATRGATLSGSAAIRGETTESSGEHNGVVGVSSSPDGAGVVAAGTTAGADLLLDGSTSTESDTMLSQGGIDRPSASPEVFLIENSGGGGLTLSVAGAVAAASVTGDGSGLTGVSAHDVECTGCVDGDEIVNGSIFGADIASGTVTGSNILNNSIQSADIANESITEFDLAPGSVGSSEIRAQAVRGTDLAFIRVASVECNGECDDSSLSQICGTGYRAIAVDCAHVDADTAGAFACGGDNICSHTTLSDGFPLSVYCDDDSGWDAQIYCLPD